MKRFVLLALTLALLRAEGAVEVGAFPQPSGIAGGISTNLPIGRWTADKRILRLTLAFTATPTNSVLVSFGADRDGDGILSAEELELTAGWDCGLWILDPCGFTPPMTGTPSVTGGRLSLDLDLRLDASGRVAHGSVLSDGSPLFGLSADAPPGWLFSKSWDLARLDVRGLPPTSGNAVIVYANDGMVIRID
ncbi:MAG: hypothetical protein J6336_07615 [Kiritimatiellae bacterium]|nr:hypothetical protein [Kiritimatiellia bacterium]